MPMIIPARFNGPPRSGNGGYTAAVLAGGETCEVTLLRPPPLDVPLTSADGVVRSPDGAIVARLAPLGDPPGVLAPIDYGESVRASAEFAGFTDHPFPTCYVCGPQRRDGLRIFAGRIEDGTTAAPWTVPDDVCPATVWAALDCPGGWAVMAAGRPFVLGRIGVLVERLPEPGDRCVVRGGVVGAEGRKAVADTALYGPDGDLLARARATWIAPAR